MEETDAGKIFSFESIELSELLELRVDEIFGKEQLEYFEALGIINSENNYTHEYLAATMKYGNT